MRLGRSLLNRHRGLHGRGLGALVERQLVTASPAVLRKTHGQFRDANGHDGRAGTPAVPTEVGGGTVGALPTVSTPGLYSLGHEWSVVSLTREVK
jgi:hypothetical protein